MPAIKKEHAAEARSLRNPRATRHIIRPFETLSTLLGLLRGKSMVGSHDYSNGHYLSGG